VSSPLVSVVIPTRDRPALAVRAARSALAQTLRDLEVVVVLDGPDRRAADALESIADPRLRLEVLPRPFGPGAARNAGACAASADWVAFLDDDDEWIPRKLAEQLATAASSPLRHPIGTCRVLASDGKGPGRVWPRRLPGPGEPLSEYLLARRGPFWGETLVHTSTLLVERAVLDRVPFREDLRRHEDLDWLLRAAREPGAGLAFAAPEEPLAVWHIEDDRPRASRVPDWEGSLVWIRSVRPLVTPRAYAAFVLAWVVPDAVGSGRRAPVGRLVWEAARTGRPAPIDLLVAAGASLVPAGARRRVGAFGEAAVTSRGRRRARRTPRRARGRASDV
jgi:hypothetical protein